MEFVLNEIIKGTLIAGLIVFISFILEVFGNMNLLFDMFAYPKNVRNARGAADFHASVYFIICLLTLLWDFHFSSNATPEYWFWKWLVIMIPLVVIFQILYFKYTAKDPNKEYEGWGQHDNN